MNAIEDARPVDLFPPGPFLPVVPADRKTLELALLPAGTTLLFYLLSLPERVPGDHAGEFATAAAVDGVPHAPGYPLWCMLAWCAAHLAPGSTVVARVALLSALSAALAAGFLTVWLRQQDVGRRAAVLGGLLLGFGFSVWKQAVMPGPYALSLLFVLLLWVVAAEWLASRAMHWLPILALVVGLGLFQHPTFAAAALVTLVALVPRRPALRIGWRTWCAVLIAFLAGAASVAYLPLAAAREPYIDSGHIDSLAALWAHLRGYSAPALGELDFGRAFGDAPAWSGWTIAASIPAEHAWVGAPLALLGLVVQWRRHRMEAAASLALGAVVIATTLAIGERTGGMPTLEAGALVLPAHALSAALAAHAVDAFLQRFGNAPPRRARLCTALAALLPLAVIAVNARGNDYSDYRYCEEYARNSLGLVPDQAILFTDGGFELYPFLYLQGALDQRPDVVLAERCGELERARLPVRLDAAGGAARGSEPSVAEAIVRLLERETRPVFATRPILLPADCGWGWSEVGLLYRAGPIGDPERERANEAAWAQLRFSHLPVEPPGSVRALGAAGAPLDETARRIAAAYYGALARRYARRGESEASDRSAALVQSLLGAD